MRLGAGERLSTPAAAPTGLCPAYDAQLLLGPGRWVRLRAFGAGCDTSRNTGPGNGAHGVYRTADDIPADRRASITTVTVPLGEATLFEQPYYECTNQCRTYHETVAVVRLAHPQDPGLPTLTVYAERGAVSRDDLAGLLRDRIG